MSEKRILSAILALFFLLGSSYALLTPAFEASDELWHYPMIRHLADGNPLPVQVFDPALAGPWRQEASQPPLYYYLGAALTFWVDASDMEEVRWLNPHVDNGVITVDGNINLAIHDPARSGWQGALLAVRIVRLFSVLLGALTVWLTYLIAKEAAPQRADIALGAAAVNAFLPMFLFISGAVNNDNLAVPLASLGVLLLIRAVTRKVGGWRYWLLVGVVIGLAVLTKQGTFALLPLAWGTLFIARWQQWQGAIVWRRMARALAESLAYFAWLLLPVLLIAGWWYWRNIQLYGDFLGWNAFIAVLGSRAQPATLAQLWGERAGFMMSFWGLFGGVNVPMSGWVYAVLNGVALTAVFGFFFYLAQQVLFPALGWQVNEWRLPMNGRQPQTSIPQSTHIVVWLLDTVVRHFPLVVLLLFTGAVIFGLVQWATTTWSSQGRLVFTALSPLCVLWVLGVAGWLPARYGRWLVGALATFMFMVAAVAPWVWIAPAYRAEAYRPPRVLVLQPLDVAFAEGLRLTGFATAVQDAAQGAAQQAQPGQYVDVVLRWQVTQAMARNWSVFVHLHDPVLGRPIAQRDMYHGQGLRPTSLLSPGEELQTFYRLFIPPTAVSPADLAVMVGLYDVATGERLRTTDGHDAITLQAISLQPIPGEYPNATAVNFMNELELLGYALQPRQTQPGGAAAVTLYVQARRPLRYDYSFSVQAVNLQDTTRWGSHDLTLPTSTWLPGEVQTIEMPFTLAADTPPEVYPLILVIYRQAEDGSWPRLQLVAADGRITQDNFLLLTYLRVDR